MNERHTEHLVSAPVTLTTTESVPWFMLTHRLGEVFVRFANLNRSKGIDATL